MVNLSTIATHHTSSTQALSMTTALALKALKGAWQKWSHQEMEVSGHDIL